MQLPWKTRPLSTLHSRLARPSRTPNDGPVELAFDPITGLIPAIAQDRLTGEIRMFAYMNREALERTIATRRATFYSRSRRALWVKGETSGNSLKVERVIADCDADVVLLLVDPEGPSCHTGRSNCFFHEVSETGSLSELRDPDAPLLKRLERVILDRTESTIEKSYTRALLTGGARKIGEKLREEADELARALESESEERVASEAADSLFHVLVGLRLRGMEFRRVLENLAGRFGQSGHAEKAGRKPSPT